MTSDDVSELEETGVMTASALQTVMGGNHMSEIKERKRRPSESESELLTSTESGIRRRLGTMELVRHILIKRERVIISYMRCEPLNSPRKGPGAILEDQVKFHTVPVWPQEWIS
jgi:hypothetical protein